MADKTQETSSNTPISPVSRVVSGVEKLIGEQVARYESAVTDLKKIQASSVLHAHAFIESATRTSQEQLVFAEQIGSEWRKLALAATRGAAELFVSKA